MSSTTQEVKYAWRFPPCPGYDVEATESWLQEMAAQGLILSTEGFCAGLGCFERGEPRRLRYRLEAAPKKPLDEDGPDEEARSLSEAYGWQYVARRYRGSLAAYFLLLLVFLGSLLALWNADARGGFTEPYEDWQGKLPFATLEDFFPGAEFSPRDGGLLESTVDVHSDILAPQIFSVHQTGSLRLPDGRVFTGGLTVDYYETAAPWMARELAREYEWYDHRRNRKYYEPLELPDELAADHASAYSAVFPTVVLVKGNRMVRASLYQTSENVSIPLGEWTAILADSLG